MNPIASLKPLIASFAATLALLSAPTAATAAGTHEHTPKHGGVVAETKDMDYELVAKPDVITLHVRAHGKAPDISQASAKLTLLSGKEKSEVTLAPAGDKLQAKGNFQVAAGTKVVAVVTWAGKAPATARFTVK